MKTLSLKKGKSKVLKVTKGKTSFTIKSSYHPNSLSGILSIIIASPNGHSYTNSYLSGMVIKYDFSELPFEIGSVTLNCDSAITFSYEIN